MIKSTDANKSKKVVVILPYVNNKVLLQLRDVKESISFPGYWGFFGGSIDNGETPETAAKRELFEEIGYKPSFIQKLGFEIIPDLGNMRSHAYCCPLIINVEKIKVMEGLDCGIFSLEEIMAKELYSRRMDKSFPVIEIPYFVYTIRRLWEYLKL